MITKLIAKIYRAVRRQHPKKEDPINSFWHELPAKTQKEIEIVEKDRKEKNFANFTAPKTANTNLPARNTPNTNIRITHKRKIGNKFQIMIPIQIRNNQLAEYGKININHPFNILPSTNTEPGILRMPEKVRKTKQAPRTLSPQNELQKINDTMKKTMMIARILGHNTEK
ncbi:hypothetical protein MA16_Dca024684 [Dendrobium catenatum]|uniref:Uncharacterized protein n=1 Tax=Dendrobium catenatum TaxID=906689 RepID=A0A2I0VGN8_9ASPA|nr:hypothetical protein MA16_Dca024684 [Dendrobium catenatum]